MSVCQSTISQNVKIVNYSFLFVKITKLEMYSIVSLVVLQHNKNIQSYKTLQNILLKFCGIMFINTNKVV